MLSALVGVEPADVSVGMPVRVHFSPVGDYTLPFFVPDPVPGGRPEIRTEAIASVEDRRKDFRL